MWYNENSGQNRPPPFSKGGNALHTVYLDVLLVIDLYMNYLLLRLTAGITHTRMKPFRGIAAALAGCLPVVLVFFPQASAWITVPVRIGGAVLVCGIAFGFRDGRALLGKMLAFLGVSMLTAGALLALSCTGWVPVIYAGGGWYPDLSLTQLLGMTIAVYLALTVIGRIRERHAGHDDRYQLRIRYGAHAAAVQGLADTGNSLTDFVTGLPVVICSRESLPGLVPEVFPCPGFRPLPFETAAGSGVVWVFRPDEALLCSEISGRCKRVDVLIGVSEQRMSNAVFHPKLLRD